MRPYTPAPNDHEASSMDEDSGIHEYGEESMLSEEEFTLEDTYSVDHSEQDEQGEDGDECEEIDNSFEDYAEYHEDEEDRGDNEDEDLDNEELSFSEDRYWWSGGGFSDSISNSFNNIRRHRINSLSTLLSSGTTTRSPIRPILNEKTIYPKANDAVAEQVLNNPPVFHRSWAYHSLSYLAPGRSFSGTQNQIFEPNRLEVKDQDRWEVKVTIHSLDQSTGTVVGLMEALNVPVASSTVVTYWEGEVIDFVNYNLWTRKWGATEKVDIDHWKRFEAFDDLRDSFLHPSSYSEVYEKYIFMRWKEKFFVNILAHESGLTIAGFYYICVRRSDGFIEGFYYDPTSKPFQRLALYPMHEGSGLGFGEYTFA